MRDKPAPAFTGMLIDGVHITTVKYVRDLGIYIDADQSIVRGLKGVLCVIICPLILTVCGCMSRKRCRVASPILVNCVRSADMYLPPHSRS